MRAGGLRDSRRVCTGTAARTTPRLPARARPPRRYRVSLRPGILIHGVGTGGDEALAEPSEWRNGLIARADVALGIVCQVDQPAEVRKAVMLIG